MRRRSCCAGRWRGDSLQLAVVDRLTPLERYAWVVDHLPRLPGTGIVYTLTVADAERLASRAAGACTATRSRSRRTPVGWTPTTRERLEDDLRANRLKALVATSALGMGYDKPDLGFVVHVGSPPSPGLVLPAGRPRRPRRSTMRSVVLLPSEADAGVWDYFATATIPDPDQVERLLVGLERRTGRPSPACRRWRRRPACAARRVELMLKQLAVDGAVERVEGGWVRTGAAVVRTTPSTTTASSRSGAARPTSCAPTSAASAASCSCSRSRSTTRPPSRAGAARSAAARCPTGLDAAARRSRRLRAGSPGAARRDATCSSRARCGRAATFGSRGRIPADVMAEPKDASLIYADAPEWRELIQAGFAPDTPAPEDVLAGCVALMSRWRTTWAERPEVVVALSAAGATRLVAETAAHLAGVGHLDLAEVGIPDNSVPDGLASAAEAAWWRDHLPVTPELASAVDGRPVLLVVDASSSMWPVTLAAAALREAGARRVLPLVIHRRVG